MRKSINVLMCGSDVNLVKGGMVSVIKNYLSCTEWEEVQIHYVPTHIDGGSLNKMIFFAAAYMRVFKMLLFSHVDVIHLHMAERGSFFRKAYLVRMAKHFRVPVLIHHHGAEFFPFYESLSDMKKEYVRKILLMANWNLVLSKFTEEQYRSSFEGIRTRVLSNAAPAPDRNMYRPQGKYIITLGRLGRRKGTYDLLKAVEKIDRKLPEEYQLCLCGDGEVEQIRAEVKRLGLEKRIAHIGWVEGGRKEEFLDGACIHVLPSYYEGLPMSILETMSRGIPNIGTRIAAVPEVIEDGKNGILIEPGDIGGLEEAILKLVRDETLREALSGAAYRTVAERFSFDFTRRELERMYRETAGERK